MRLFKIFFNAVQISDPVFNFGKFTRNIEADADFLTLKEAFYSIVNLLEFHIDDTLTVICSGQQQTKIMLSCKIYRLIDKIQTHGRSKHGRVKRFLREQFAQHVCAFTIEIVNLQIKQKFLHTFKRIRNCRQIHGHKFAELRLDRKISRKTLRIFKRIGCIALRSKVITPEHMGIGKFHV